MRRNDPSRSPDNARGAKPAVVRTPDRQTRDPRKVSLGGIIKAQPARLPPPAVRDSGKVVVGGIIKKMPVSLPGTATRDPGKVRVGGIIQRRPIPAQPSLPGAPARRRSTQG